MSLIMMEAPTAGEMMIPMPEPVGLHATVAEALRRMAEDEAEFLTVVSPTNRKLLGLVAHHALKACSSSEGHDPASCPVVRHLDANPEFCFQEENADEVLRIDEEWSAERHDSDEMLPVVVVDADKIPVGYLER